MKDLRKESACRLLLRDMIPKMGSERKWSQTRKRASETKYEWIGRHHRKVMFHPARSSKETYEMCFRIFHLQDKRARFYPWASILQLLRLKSGTSTSPHDPLGPCVIDPREQPHCLGSKQDTGGFTWRSLSGARVQWDTWQRLQEEIIRGRGFDMARDMGLTHSAPSGLRI